MQPIDIATYLEWRKILEPDARPLNANGRGLRLAVMRHEKREEYGRVCRVAGRVEGR